MRRFEDRHRELRRALSWTTEDHVHYRKRLAEVRDFEARTGPPVDDFVAAVRVLANCSPTADPFPLIAWERAHDDVRAKLTALDEASEVG